MTKILIADDEPNILMLASAVFEDLGYQILEAADGEEAVALAVAEKPDLIITDIIMPKMDGFDVCKKIRNTPEIADTPIIILSAMGDEYNKITGFDGGADDYVTKPFNVEELKARVKALLLRYQSRTKPVYKDSPSGVLSTNLDYIPTGCPEIDESLNGGLPKGSNILVVGPLGAGKSSFSREFIIQGINDNERNLFVAIDDDPVQVRRKLSEGLDAEISYAEELGLLQFVDAYSWASMTEIENDTYAVSGTLELNQLSGVIADAGLDIGHSIQHKLGGRRVLDTISSLLVNFDLPAVQRFIGQIARTSLAFGGVTTLFMLEEGSVDNHVLNNIKYVMDGVIEVGLHEGIKSIRVSSMKWISFDPSWKPLSLVEQLQQLFEEN